MILQVFLLFEFHGTSIDISCKSLPDFACDVIEIIVQLVCYINCDLLHIAKKYLLLNCYRILSILRFDLRVEYNHEIRVFVLV